MEEVLEHSFTCPYCTEEISMELDLSSDGENEYVEDCQVCCRPIEVFFRAFEGGLEDFAATASDS